MNHEYGNITMDDADRLRNLTKELYYYLYSHYEEMEEINDMTDESLILEYDIFLKKHNIFLVIICSLMQFLDFYRFDLTD